MSTKYSRRRFLRYSGLALGMLLGGGELVSTLAQSNSKGARAYHGHDLSGWELVLGDAIYYQAGEAPVTLADIETQSLTSHSLLRANIHVRDIMAHNITFKRFIDDTALAYNHLCSYQFRLPYIPSTHNQGLNPQTIEGGLFIWDGNKKIDYGLAFQWVLNPWQSDFGDIYTWNEGGTGWDYAGSLAVDTRWHRVQFSFHFESETAQLTIDGRNYPAAFSKTTDKVGFGDEIAARLQAEIVSLYPGENGAGALHEAMFRNWHWVWTAR